MCLRFNHRYLNDRDMEKKKVVVELEVLTARMTSREIERDLDKLLVPLNNIETGQTTIVGTDIITVR